MTRSLGAAALASAALLAVAVVLWGPFGKDAPRKAAAFDLNADGRSDVLYRHWPTGRLHRLLMDGAKPVSGSDLELEPDPAWTVASVADFNGDGVADLLLRNDSTGQARYVPMARTGLPASPASPMGWPTRDWQVAATPDVDGNGKADIVWWNRSTGQVYVALTDGAFAAGMVHTEPNLAWRIVAAGDFAGGGKANQLLWRNGLTGQVFLMTITASGSLFRQTGVDLHREPDTAWKIVGAADFDGDGGSDLLWRNDANGKVVVMQVGGARIARSAQVHQEPDLAWKIVAQGDYDADGKADILWRNESTGRVSVMLMNGPAVRAIMPVYQEPDAAWRIVGPHEWGAMTGFQGKGAGA